MIGFGIIAVGSPLIFTAGDLSTILSNDGFGMLLLRWALSLIDSSCSPKGLPSSVLLPDVVLSIEDGSRGFLNTFSVPPKGSFDNTESRGDALRFRFSCFNDKGDALRCCFA